MSAGNSTIGALKILLGLDSAQFEAGLKKSQGGLANFAKSAGFTVAAIGAAVAGAAIAMGAAVKASIDAADELEETAQKIGVGVTELSRLSYAAKISGVGLDQLTTGLKKLSVNLDGVATGSGGKAGDALERLGISATDANGKLKGSDDVLKEVAGKFAGMEDGATKTALAVALFGKAGSDLIPLLNEGKDGVAELEAEADKLGVTLDANAAAAAGRFNENLDKLKAVGQGVTNQIAGALAPALEDITGGFLAAAGNAGAMKTIGQVLGVTLKALATVAVGVGSAFAQLGNILGTIAGVIVKVFKGDFDGALETARNGVTQHFKVMSDNARALSGIWLGTGEKIAATSGKASDDIASPIVKAAGKSKAAAKVIDKAADDAKKSQEEAARYLAGLQKGLDNRGLSGDEVTSREALAQASEYAAKGMIFEAAQAARLAEEYRKLEASERKVIDLSPSLVNSSGEIGEGLRKVADDAETEAERLERFFYGVSDSVQQTLYAIAGNDWVGAFSGLSKALSQIGLAFDKTASSADRFAAIAGVGNAVGGAVGGKAGGALSGAASGAAAGTAILPGIGTAIGGILGGLGGLLGGNKAKKKAKAEAKAREEQRLADIAVAKRQLEIEIMERSGDVLGALAARRADEKASADASLHGLLDQVYAMEDAAAAAEKLANATAFFNGAFLTEAERIAPVAAEVASKMAALGFASVDTREEFKALVQGLDLSTEAGVAARDALLALAPAFDQVATASEAAAAAAEAQTAANAATLRGLNIDFLRLTGKDSQATALEREDILKGETSQDIIDALKRNWAQTDKNAAASEGLGSSIGDLNQTIKAKGLDGSKSGAEAIANVASMLRAQIEKPATYSWVNDNVPVPGTGGKTVTQQLENKAVQAALTRYKVYWAQAAAVVEEFGDQLKGVTNSLAEFANELAFGDLSILSPQAQLDAAIAAFADAAPKALLGDFGGLQVLESVGRQLIESQRAITGSGVATAQITDLVARTAEAASKVKFLGPPRDLDQTFYTPSGSKLETLTGEAANGLRREERGLLEEIRNELKADKAQRAAISAADQKSLKAIQDSSAQAARLAAQSKAA